MKFAITVGAFQMVEFCELNIRCCRHVFGEDIPILLSDDWSSESVRMRELADKMNVHHCVGGPRGHFAGDTSAAVHALAFARQVGAELSLKLSQRFLLIDPVAEQVLSNHFASPNIWLGVPGRISAHTIKQDASRFFAHFSVLSDIVCVRTESITPEMLKERYETRVRNAGNQHDKLAESLWSNLLDTHFSTHTVVMNEFSHPGTPPIYLRKAQSHPADYERAAEKMGMRNFNAVLVEWNRLSATYRPVPSFL